MRETARTNRPQSELIRALFRGAVDGGDIFNESSSPRHRRRSLVPEFGSKG
jgi:hypothetical protein